MSSRIVCCASRHRGTGTACAGRMQRLCVSQEMFRYLQTGTCTACVGRVLLQKKAAPFGTAVKSQCITPFLIGMALLFWQAALFFNVDRTPAAEFVVDLAVVAIADPVDLSPLEGGFHSAVGLKICNPAPTFRIRGNSSAGGRAQCPGPTER